jgi:hypothetical protein
MIGPIVLGAALLYFLVSFAIVRVAIGYARKNSKCAKCWGWGAALVMYMIPFWDWIPTVATHQFYCAKDSGFWVYKTLDQWKAENPGVMETLVVNEILAPSKHEGDEDNWTNTYLLNQRINQVSKHQGTLPFYRWKYEVAVVDSKTNEVLARSVDFYTTQVRAGGGWHGWKFWLATDHCFSHKKGAVQFGNYINEFKGVKK